MRKNDLKRDKGIKKRLEREFQVDRPPESYFQAVQDAFDSLPDELPVKVRPLPQRVLRTCAALAACLVLVAVGAFGLNLVSPGLMESMPGVGQIFQELNQTNVEPTPQPEDPSSLAEVQEDLPAVPPFEPVTFPSASGNSTLTVENAWSDGLYLHLDLLLETWEVPSGENGALASLSPCQTPYDPSSSTALVLESGKSLENLASTDYQLDFLLMSESTGQDGGTLYQASWVYRLPQREEHGAQLDIILDLPGLFLFDAQYDYTQTALSFSGNFEVTVDASQTFLEETSVESNGITLESVQASPSCVIAQVRIPDFGNVNSTLLAPYDQMVNGGTPLGVYGQLTTQDGTVLEEENLTQYAADSTLLTHQVSLGISAPYEGAVVFAAPPQGTSQLILTFYEYPQAFYEQYSSASDTPVQNRVTAEFTIDLEQRLVYPSQHYQEEGRQLLDYRQGAAATRTPTPENGYICGAPNATGAYLELFFYTTDLDYRPVELVWYDQGQYASSYLSQPEDQYNVSGSGHYYYQDERYSYSELSMDPALTGNVEYKLICFQIYDLGDFSSVLNSPNTRFALMDTETGETLVNDVLIRYMQSMDQVFGTTLMDDFTDRFPEEAIPRIDGASPNPATFGEESALF